MTGPSANWSTGAPKLELQHRNVQLLILSLVNNRGKINSWTVGFLVNRNNNHKEWSQ